MDVQTAKAVRRSTRLRVEIPVSIMSLDRKRPFAEKCTVLLVSAHGCGFRSPRPLQMETPIMLTGLPGDSSVTARVVSCLPLGEDGTQYLIGASLYTHGNVWGIANPPEDWSDTSVESPAPAAPARKAAPVSPKLQVNKKAWPYNLFADGVVVHPGRKSGK